MVWMHPNAVFCSRKPGTFLCLLVIGFLFLGGSFSSVSSLQEFFVDGTNGNDNNNGTSIAAPWQTLTRAQQAIQELNSNGASEAVEVQISIREGTYSFLSSPWSLTSLDSGGTKAISSIVWTAYLNETVDVVAGIPIPSSSWSPSSTVVGAYFLNLKEVFLLYNISNEALGSLPGPNELGDCSKVHGMELFFNQNPMYLARYPNINANGTWRWETAGPRSFNLTLDYSGDRPSQWVNETNLRIHGYWQFDWADSWVEVSEIDTTSNMIKINPSTPPLYGSVAAGARWMVLNALAELDAPGEYYIDNVNYLLYFIPPLNGSIESGDSWLSIGSNVLTLSGLTDTTFNQLNFYYAQQGGINADGISNVHFVGCTIANHGTLGISFSGYNSSISVSNLYGTGCGGISTYGGVQSSLTSGNISIVGNHIENFARTIRTYTPGIGFAGVGNYYGYNTIENGPHVGFLGGGNNMLLEYNTLYRLCFETTDAGAFYTGRSWTNWGNVLQHNSFSHINLDENPGGVGTTNQVQAIYLDDQMSGWHVYNNTILNAQVGILVGGGRMNNITQNHFQGCELAIYFDNRGMNWQASYCTPPNGTFELELEALNYLEPPFSVEYPWLLYLLKERPCVPVYNRFQDNTYCLTSTFINQDQKDFDDWEDVYQNNVEISC